MQLFEVKSNIAKITYNPAENRLLPTDFLLVEDNEKRLIAQIIAIETTEDTNNNLAVLKFAITIDKEDNLSFYNGHIPAKDAKIIYINPDEIIELLQGNDINIYWGNLSTHPNCFVKTPIDFLNDKLLICSDRNEKTTIITKNILTELQNKNKKTVLVDFDGKYKNITNAQHIKLSETFKLPLNIDAFNTILEHDIVDCPLEDIALIQSIVLELREYLKTLKDKYLPFTTFKQVVETELASNPISGLMLFRNKLWLYAQENIFAEKKSDFDILNTLIENNSAIVIDATDIDEKWHKFIIQTLQNLIEKYCYLILPLNDIKLDKKFATSIYQKQNIIPIATASYEGQNIQILNAICKNQILCKPLKQIENDEENVHLLNKINVNEFLLYGETTLNLPLIVEIQSFTPSTIDAVIENEIKKDVDKLLSSPQTIIPIDATKPQEDDAYKIIEEDDLLESDLDFLDEEWVKIEKLETNETTAKKEYETFSPITLDDKEQELEDLLTKAVQEIKPEEEITIETENEEETISQIEPIQTPQTVESIEQIEVNKESVENIEDDETGESVLQIEEQNNETSTINMEEQDIPDEENKTEDYTETSKNTDEEFVVELETDEEELPPPVEQNINTRKSPEITVYETDNSETLSPSDFQLEVGDKVSHPKYGIGTIEGFASYGNKILFCSIVFENAGRKMLQPGVSAFEKVME